MCAGDRPARCPNHFFAVNEVSAVPWWWCDLFWRHEVACGVRWSKAVGCEVTWGVLLWLVVTWHVMSRHVIWCDVIDCVASCRVDAMRCHGDELLFVVHCNELKMPLVVRSHCAVRSGSVTMWWPKVLLCTTKYYTTTPVLLQSTTRVRLCTAQYYSSTTLYYKVLLQYCACHAKWISWLIRVTCETSFPTRGASKVTFQTRQVLRRDFEFKISARNPWIASANIKTIRG